MSFVITYIFYETIVPDHDLAFLTHETIRFFLQRSKLDRLTSFLLLNRSKSIIRLWVYLYLHARTVEGPARNGNEPAAACFTFSKGWISLREDEGSGNLSAYK